VFNLYRGPTIELGDPKKASRWVESVYKLFSNDACHLIKWPGHRRQRPGEKINHMLVLGGKPGIGKDTLLEPVKRAVGPCFAPLARAFSRCKWWLQTGGIAFMQSAKVVRPQLVGRR
jgi:hypothetical protein